MRPQRPFRWDVTFEDWPRLPAQGTDFRKPIPLEEGTLVSLPPDEFWIPLRPGAESWQPKADFYSYGSIPIVTARAKTLLQEVVPPGSIEWIQPLMKEAATGFVLKELWFAIVLPVVDCIDQGRSQYQVRERNGEEEFLFGEPTQLFLDLERVPDGPAAFRLKRYRTCICVTPKIVSFLKKAKLRKLPFEELWWC